jgi:endonuclease-8
VEGPSLFILKEEMQQFKGRKVLSVKGYAELDPKRILDKKVIDFKTWGKHFLVCFKGFTLKIHFGLFGSYKINAQKAINAKLSLVFDNGELNCYVCSIKFIEQPLNEVYDWRLDMLSDEWDPVFVKKVLLQQDPDKQIGDLLLNPGIFSGVGNIIRNEVLYRAKVHPESLLGKIPSRKITEIIKQTHLYSLDFLKWRRKGELSRHWEVYKQSSCPKEHSVFVKDTGKTKRRSFICTTCMIRYG